MRVFVTGATGYIGRWLCRALSERGDLVTALSRLPDSTMDSVDKWVTGDLSDQTRLETNLSGCETIIHLACMPMGESDANASGAFEVNARGTANLLQAALSAGISGMVYTSTGQVYGGSQTLPNNEEQIPAPAGPYAASKLCAEVWGEMVSVSNHFPLTTLRLFNVFGPSQDVRKPRRTVENIFLDLLLHGSKPTINGSPLSGRDFVFIEDVVRAILLSIDSQQGHRLMNIGTGRLTTLAGLAELAAKTVGVSTSPIIAGSETDVAVRFQADMSRARSMLGFSASISLEDGLKLLLEQSAGSLE